MLLGTPNRGSFAPVQALRGTYAVVRKIARLDGATTVERLTEEVFNSFPSLYQMIPVSSRKGTADLFDPDAWPHSGPALRPALLERARRFRDRLPPADERFVAVAGVGQETVTAVSKGRDGFVYTITRHGDGTVPADSAALDGASTYFTNTSHSDLTRDAHVASAIVELLRKGSTKRLPTRWTSNSRAQARVTDRRVAPHPLRQGRLGEPHAGSAAGIPAERQRAGEATPAGPREPPQCREALPPRSQEPSLSQMMQELSYSVPHADHIVRVALRMAVALVIGTVIGLQRELSHKPAGLRTHLLVSLGTALLVVAAVNANMKSADISRVIQGLITGIGFLGGGTILKLTQEHEIRGLTTAAGIWLTAAASVAAGLGEFAAAFIGVFFALIVLIAVGKLGGPSADRNETESTDRHIL